MAAAIFKSFAAEALTEELGHGGAAKVLGHYSGSAAKDDPCQQGADEGVAQTYPCGSDTVLPAELTGIADEDNGGEVGSAVGKGGEPGAYISSAEDEAVYVRGVLAAVNAYADGYSEEYYENENFE